ncbi:sulfite exporter TauE/SafE family protein [Myxococcota bacterium]
MLPFETLFASWPQYVATCLLLAVAQAVYVLFGFGGGLVAVGCLALVLVNIQDVVVMLVLVYLPAELYVAVTSRKEISWRGVLLVCAGVAGGVPLGAWLLKHSEPTFVLALLAGFLIVAGLAFLLLPRHRSVRWPPWTAPPVGALAGLLGGMFGTGGPPVILYYQLGGMAKSAFRGSLMTIFLFVSLVRLPAYATAGLITEERLVSSLAVMPVVLIGAWLGNRIHLQMAEQTFQRLVSVFLIVVGLVIGARWLGP